MNSGKHSFLPLTRLEHHQNDTHFEAAFDVERTPSSASVSSYNTGDIHNTYELKLIVNRTITLFNYYTV